MRQIAVADVWNSRDQSEVAQCRLQYLSTIQLSSDLLYNERGSVTLGEERPTNSPSMLLVLPEPNAVNSRQAFLPFHHVL